MSVVVGNSGIANAITNIPKISGGLEYPEFKPSSATRHTLLSGVEVRQEVANSSVVTDVPVQQSFRLPVDFKRGNEASPDITGVSICCSVTDVDAFHANLTLYVEEFGDLLPIAQGSVNGAAAVGDKIWIDCYFNEPIQIPDEYTQRFFHLEVRANGAIWYSYPATFFGTATVGQGGNLAFRVLTNTADSGVDFLGNRFRSIVRTADPERFNSTTGTSNSFWMSKPNPSKFAVESLYFDVSDGLNHASVVDRILLDPITPNVYFNLYYTDEGDPGETEAEWENKLWTPVFQTFKAERRQEHSLPVPITAKYVKVEFSHLQPQVYAPGIFHQAIRYKKHPKWVLDYFMSRLSRTTEDPYVASRISVVFDALRLAYDYYTDDLEDGNANPPVQDVAAFLSDRTDQSDEVETALIDQISLATKPYRTRPINRASNLDALLANMAISQTQAAYSTERINSATADTTQVSSLDREQLIVENNYPVMFFYLTCRHKYRELETYFEDNKAYFVGVRELAFTREHYVQASDTAMYTENLGDFTNAWRNDFIEDEHIPFNV
jgi:hypothetical protein